MSVEDPKPQRQAYGYAGDEISLVDLWLVLARRKWTALVILAVCILTGLVFWQTKASQERYLTTIEIGRVINEQGSLERIEAREAVENRLRNSILPKLRHGVADFFAVDINALPVVLVRVPAGAQAGDFVLLETTTDPDNFEMVKALHQGSVDLLFESHELLFKRFYEKRFSIGLSQRDIDLAELQDEHAFRLREMNAENALAEAEATLEEMKEDFRESHQNQQYALERQRDLLAAATDDFTINRHKIEISISHTAGRVVLLGEQEKRLTTKLENLAVESELLNAQLVDINEWMDDYRKHQKSLYEQIANDGTTALPVMMIGNQLELARKEYGDIKHRLSVRIPERRAELSYMLQENSLAMVEANQALDALKMQLEILEAAHVRDISERKRNIVQLEGAINIAEFQFQREQTASAREIEKLKVRLKRLYNEQQRSVDRMKQEIALYKTDMGRMKETGAPAVAVPAQSIGRGGARILGFSAVIGLMLGIFGAFFAEFAASARKAAQR